jgi:hypothetical protein
MNRQSSICDVLFLLTDMDIERNMDIDRDMDTDTGMETNTYKVTKNVDFFISL